MALRVETQGPELDRDPNPELAENVETLGRRPSGRNSSRFRKLRLGTCTGTASHIALHGALCRRWGSVLAIELCAGNGATGQLRGGWEHGVLNPTPPTNCFAVSMARWQGSDKRHWRIVTALQRQELQAGLKLKEHRHPFLIPPLWRRHLKNGTMGVFGDAQRTNLTTIEGLSL